MATIAEFREAQPSRRIGGLEKNIFLTSFQESPSRRIGGLETKSVLFKLRHFPSRRIGGLENNVTY